MKADIASIIREFQVRGTFLDAKPFGNGHLHDTYKVEVQSTGQLVAYILQRINSYAFRNPQQLMENINRITAHILGKLQRSGFTPAEIARRVLNVIHTHQGGGYFTDREGNYWRMFTFIAHTRSYDIIHDPHRLFQAAFMFGGFLRMLEDLPSPALFDSIPDFHNGTKRLAVFLEAVHADTTNRAQAAKREIDFVLGQISLFDVVPRLVEQGKIPLRPTHNDTKVNNVLLDETTGQGMCVIDLDTTMSGVSLYDFGDLARTTLSIQKEDEQDLSTVFAEIPRFKIILEGFLTGAGDSLSVIEKDYLVFSTKFMPMIIGLRFLTDYLLGDVYFKIHRPEHNLDRCKRQFKMVQSIIEREEEMLRVTEQCIITTCGIVPPELGRL